MINRYTAKSGEKVYFVGIRPFPKTEIIYYVYFRSKGDTEIDTKHHLDYDFSSGRLRPSTGLRSDGLTFNIFDMVDSDVPQFKKIKEILGEI